MKKLIAILAVFFVIGTISAFAHGIGLQGGANISAKGGANIGGSGAITFKLDSLPWVFAVDGAFYSDYIGLGLTADMWIGNPVISKPLRWYYGWGVAGSIGFGDPVGLSAGLRVLAGLNFKVLDNVLEFYLQAAWQPTIIILPEIGFNVFYFPVVGGFRFWF